MKPDIFLQKASGTVVRGQARGFLSCREGCWEPWDVISGVVCWELVVVAAAEAHTQPVENGEVQVV